MERVVKEEEWRKQGGMWARSRLEMWGSCRKVDSSEEEQAHPEGDVDRVELMEGGGTCGDELSCSSLDDLESVGVFSGRLKKMEPSRCDITRE